MLPTTVTPAQQWSSFLKRAGSPAFAAHRRKQVYRRVGKLEVEVGAVVITDARVALGVQCQRAVLTDAPGGIHGFESPGPAAPARVLEIVGGVVEVADARIAPGVHHQRAEFTTLPVASTISWTNGVAAWAVGSASVVRHSAAPIRIPWLKERSVNMGVNLQMTDGEKRE